MSMLGAGTSEGADKKKGIGELKMGCFNRPFCVTQYKVTQRYKILLINQL